MAPKQSAKPNAAKKPVMAKTQNDNSKSKDTTTNKKDSSKGKPGIEMTLVKGTVPSAEVLAARYAPINGKEIEAPNQAVTAPKPETASDIVAQKTAITEEKSTHPDTPVSMSQASLADASAGSTQTSSIGGTTTTTGNPPVARPPKLKAHPSKEPTEYVDVCVEGIEDPIATDVPKVMLDELCPKAKFYKHNRTGKVFFGLGEHAFSAVGGVPGVLVYLWKKYYRGDEPDIMRFRAPKTGKLLERTLTTAYICGLLGLDMEQKVLLEDAVQLTSTTRMSVLAISIIWSQYGEYYRSAHYTESDILQYRLVKTMLNETARQDVDRVLGGADKEGKGNTEQVLEHIKSVPRLSTEFEKFRAPLAKKHVTSDLYSPQQRTLIGRNARNPEYVTNVLKRLQSEFKYQQYLATGRVREERWQEQKHINAEKAARDRQAAAERKARNEDKATKLKNGERALTDAEAKRKLGGKGLLGGKRY